MWNGSRATARKLVGNLGARIMEDDEDMMEDDEGVLREVRPCTAM